jgi:hypothetical protein
LRNVFSGPLSLLKLGYSVFLRQGLAMESRLALNLLCSVDWPGTGDPPTSASQVVVPALYFLTNELYEYSGISPLWFSNIFFCSIGCLFTLLTDSLHH